MNTVPTSPRLYKVLFGSGTTFEAIIKRSANPSGVEPLQIHAINVRTTNGSFSINESLSLGEMRFPYFSFTTNLAPITAVVFNSKACAHDLVLGRACLKKMGITLDFARSVMRCLSINVPFRSASEAHKKETLIFQSANTQVNPLQVDRAIESYQARSITCSQYFKVATEQVIEAQAHLTDVQKTELGAVLERHSDLFSGRIGVYLNRELHIDLQPDDVPFYQGRPYPIKQDVLPVLKDVLDGQEKEGIIARCYESTLCMALFALP